MVASPPSAGSLKFRLVAFDLDGTLTRVSSIWQHVHEALGTWTQGARYARSFFRGEITYEQWARLDARLWRGVSLEALEPLLASVRYMQGAEEVVSCLRKQGLKVGTISAGLSLLADKAMRELGLDFSVANELVIKDGKLTGEIQVRVGYDNKGEVLKEVLRSLGVERFECATVGDDLPDLGLFRECRLAIAFNPRHAAVERAAHVVVHGDDLRLILPYLLHTSGNASRPLSKTVCSIKDAARF
ncbi:MAG: HAD family phosphatase [Candidatus Bathyarchaeia archaeon]